MKVKILTVWSSIALTLPSLLCAQSTRPANAPSRWRSFGVIAVDTTTILRENPNEIVVWFRVNSPGSVEVTGTTKKYSSSMTRIGLNCTKMLFLSRTAVYYDASGDVVTNSDETFAKWREAVPESIGEAYIRIGCRPEIVDAARVPPSF